MSSFQEVFVHNNPMAEAQRSYVQALSLSCHLTRHARKFFGPPPQGYCERNLEKTTSSVLSVLLLIYALDSGHSARKCLHIFYC